MSKFTDILNSPLPSHTDSAEAMLAAIESELGIESGEEYMEDFDDIDLASGSEPLSAEENSDVDDLIQDDEGDPSEDGSATEGSDTSVADDIEDISDDGDDDLNPDDLDDDELQKLDAELSGGSSNSDNEEKLTPEEEIQADDMMAVAATTFLVNDKLSSDEKKEFCSSESETAAAVREGFMTEADINEIAAECGLMTEARYTNKMIIRLDAESKKKQLYALAVNVSAAAHNDPDYIKLKKVMKMRKILRAKLERKYHGEATKRMKVYYNRLRNSKSNTLRKIGSK